MCFSHWLVSSCYKTYTIHCVKKKNQLQGCKQDHTITLHNSASIPCECHAPSQNNQYITGTQAEAPLFSTALTGLPCLASTTPFSLIRDKEDCVAPWGVLQLVGCLCGVRIAGCGCGRGFLVDEGVISRGRREIWGDYSLIINHTDCVYVVLLGNTNTTAPCTGGSCGVGGVIWAPVSYMGGSSRVFYQAVFT